MKYKIQDNCIAGYDFGIILNNQLKELKDE